MTRTQKKKLLHIFLYLVLIFTAILTLFPLFWGISASLRSDKELYSYIMPFSPNRNALSNSITGFSSLKFLFSFLCYFIPYHNLCHPASKQAEMSQKSYTLQQADLPFRVYRGIL